MGSGRWSAATFSERGAAKAEAGKDTFDYSERAKATGQLRPHQTLDPRGMGIRESRDSVEHPNSNAIIIGLDVTGSMGRVVRGIHADLPRLHELILGHNYVSDPQIMFAAVGDANSDAVPLQVGQFESDNRMDENLENMILEGGGGPGKTESYELMLYIAARHTATDCWQKRRRKGYLFIIGDEMAYPAVKGEVVKRTLGYDAQDLPLDALIEEARQRYHIYFVIPGGASHGDDSDVLRFWNRHLGAQSIIHLQSPADTSESIGLTIGITERGMNINDVTAELARTSTPTGTMERIRRALGSLILGSGPGEPNRTRRL
jgi:hypothetical protein